MKKIRRIIDNFVVWFMDKIAERDEIKYWVDDGVFDSERGWKFRGKFYSAERWLN